MALTLLSIDQRYNSESKSQLKDNRKIWAGCCYQSIKDIILKANHNYHNSIANKNERISSSTILLLWSIFHYNLIFRLI